MCGGQSLCVGKAPLQEQPQVLTPVHVAGIWQVGTWFTKVAVEREGSAEVVSDPTPSKNGMWQQHWINSLTRVLGSALQSPRPPGVEPIEPWGPHFQRDGCCLRGAEIRTQVSTPHSEWQLREERRAKNEKVPLWSCQSFGGCKRLEQTFQTQTVHGDTQPWQLEHGPAGWYYTMCVILMAMFKYAFSAQSS